MKLVDRIQERVDRHVVEAFDVALQALAVRAIGIREDRQFARTVTLDALEGEIQRQRVPCHPVELPQSRIGQVLLAVRVVNRTDHDVGHLRIGVDHPLVELRLVQTKIRRLGDVADDGARKLRFQQLFDRCGILRHRVLRGVRLRFLRERHRRQRQTKRQRGQRET